MSQNTSSNSSSPTVLICDEAGQNAFYKLLNQLSLIPAVIIVVIFMFLRRRAKLKKDCLDGRPGIQIPVDILGEEKNRFSYVAAYGAMAIAVTHMFINNQGSNTVFTVEGHPVVQAFQKIVTVICLGTIFLPIFVCLSTDAKLLGSIFGFFYTSMRFVGLIMTTLLCPKDISSTFAYWPIFLEFPAQLFHVVVLVRFVLVFVQEVRSKCCRKKFECSDLLGNESEFELGAHYVNHVKTLLQGVPKNDDRKWYVKGRNFVYEPQPHFKYSVAVLSCVVVAGVIIYEFLILLGGIVGYFYTYKKSLVDNYWYYVFTIGLEQYELLLKFVDIAIISLIVSMILGALFMYFQMYRMLVSHRDHVIKLIKGDRRFLPRKVNTPHVMVGQSLRFAGYQVAHFLWGFVMVAGVLLLVTLTISAGVLFLPMVFKGNQLENVAANVGYAALPTVLMAIFIFVLQQVLARFVFKDRSINSQVVNIDNRRLFLLVSFFFFFFNILVGLLSCLLRIIKGMILGILFTGRIDRPLIMKGFTNLDTAYCAYIGFLHLQVAHKHPVVRVFSHLLWSGMRRKQRQRLHSTLVDLSGASRHTAFNGWQELKGTNPSRPRVSASALNKWFIAVTVIRNPTLIYNRKGFLKHILLGIPNTPSSGIRDGSPTQCKENQVIPQDTEIEKPTSKSIEQFTTTQVGKTVLINNDHCDDNSKL